MATEVFRASEAVQDMAREIAGKHHPDLALLFAEDRIDILFQEKGQPSEDEEPPPVDKPKRGRPRKDRSSEPQEINLGKVTRMTSVTQAVAGRKVEFALVIPQETWEIFSHGQRIAMLDRMLCAIRVDVTDEGVEKYSKANPEVAYYHDELDRHGAWLPRDVQGGIAFSTEAIGSDT